MSVAGEVVEVAVTPRGSEVVDGALAGATSVTVSDPTPFEVSGGQVLIDGIPYSYSEAVEVPDPLDPTSTNGVLTLTSGLVADVGDAMPVSLWTGLQELNDVVLKVSLVPDEAPVSVTVSSSQRKDWSVLEGPVEPPVAVVLSDDLVDLVDAPGYAPSLDGAIVYDPMAMANKVASTNVGNAVWTTVADWSVYDLADVTHNGAGVFTIHTGGLYDIRLGATFAPADTGTRAVRMLYNGTELSRFVKTPSTQTSGVETNQARRMAVGDTVAFQVYQDSGGVLGVQGGSSTGMFILRVAP